jgi:hypothetical protein
MFLAVEDFDGRDRFYNSEDPDETSRNRGIGEAAFMISGPNLSCILPIFRDDKSMALGR